MTSTATASTAAPGAARIPKFNPKLFPATGSAGAIAKPLWEMELDIISTWAKANKAMLPRKPDPVKADTKDPAAEKDRYENEHAEYTKEHAAATKLIDNLLAAVKSAADEKTTDTYNILDDAFARGSDVRHTPGSIVSRLMFGGVCNAITGKEGGIVDVITCMPLVTIADAALGKKKKDASTAAEPTFSTAADLTMSQLLKYTRRFHTAIHSRVELDMISTTPTRIVQMLCPELSTTEVNGIRKRIYDTVVLGFGTNSSAAAAALEGGDHVPVAARTGVHDSEKFHKCKICGNNDQADFVMDRKNGDLICTNCGTVAIESLMHEGSAYRKFEGEADRNHHGDMPNPLFSDAHNMSTTLGGLSQQSGAGIGGYGSVRGGGLENVLRNAHSYTEMNISQFGKGEKKTRIGYKDRQKKDAFVQMNHTGDALNLHEAVVQRSKELFAGFRDDRELLIQYKGVIAACLCEAFDQLSRDGRQILRLSAEGEDKEGKKVHEDGDYGDEADDDEKGLVNARATKRNQLHSNSLAGKGGLLVGTPQTANQRGSIDKSGQIGKVGSPLNKSSTVALKTASSWDLDDCRTWLLEASRAIAKQWVEEAKNEDAREDIPKGSIDELEGRLVEHTMKLIDVVERELKGGGVSSRLGAKGRKPIVTPRASNMGSLGIKWQHSHERGSGGKGGVGGSGTSFLGKRARPGNGSANGGGRRAGQMLILKKAKRLGIDIGDAVAGEAFHRELRALLSRQEARRKKNVRDEAALQRFKQMKRKPWIQARVQL